jgi:hypothetical protein
VWAHPPFYFYGYFLAWVSLVDAFMLDLHGPDLLAEISGAAQEMDVVTHSQFAGQLDDSHTDTIVKMGYFTDSFTGHICLLALQSQSFLGQMHRVTRSNIVNRKKFIPI